MVSRRHCATNHAYENALAMSPTEVTEKLGLTRMKDRSWFCHPSNALAGDGLFEGPHPFPPFCRHSSSFRRGLGLLWLTQNLKTPKA